MIETVEIKNFRCFDKLTLKGLKPINVIVGRNASGKTAFLEALYFALGSPALALKLRGWRGLGQQIQFNESNSSRNAVWRDLFYNFDQAKRVSIEFNGTSNIERKVEIQYDRRAPQHILKDESGSTKFGSTPPLEFKYSHNGKFLTTVRPDYHADGIKLAGSPDPLPGAFFPSGALIDPSETALNFSALSKSGDADDVISALEQLFPITGLSLEINSLSTMVHTRISGKIEKVPIGLVSTGVTKVLAYLVAIANNPKGVVIIDEIENGFYYDTMVSIWTTLHAFSRKYDVQLFASTHSRECLKAIEPAVSGDVDDFSLLRAVREEDRSKINSFEGRDLLSALEEEVEIR